MVIPLIIILFHPEKVYDSEEFSHENSKPCLKSRVMTR